MIGRISSFGVFALAALAAHANAAVLFTTQEDFTGWGVGSSNTGTPSALGDTDASTTNGLGNTSSPGAAGTAGALTVTIPSGSTFGGTLSPGEQGNAAFLAALSGATVTVDYTATVAGGNYFQLLVNINSAATGYTTIAPTVTGTQGGPQTATYVMPTFPSTGQSYFQFGFVANTNNTGTVTIDNIQTTPEPASVSALALGGVALLRRRRA